MSERERYGHERYGQEPYESPESYESQRPYAAHPQEYPRQDQQTQGYDPYAAATGQQGYDPAGYQQEPAAYPDQQSYAQQQYPPRPYDQQSYEHQSYAQPQYHQPAFPQQTPYPQDTGYPRYEEPGTHGQDEPPAPEPSEPQVPPQRGPRHPESVHESAARPENPPEGEEFETGEFAFVEEEDEQAEDVIDWLKFSESRTERRDERKRRGRVRTVALIVLLAVALTGGVGYLWRAGLLPGIGSGGPAALAPGAQKRDVIVVHLRQVDSNESSSALLVRNETTGRGTMVLLPNSMSVTTDTGSTTLGKSVVDDGADPTRDALNNLLGADIQGSWRLDTPYLEILVDAVGGITLDSDVKITSGGKTLVDKGTGQQLDGQEAVSYATYRAPGESEARQLDRFGQVMQAVLMHMPSDSSTATKIVDSMGAIPDPSLSDGQLGATLGALSGLAKTGHYATTSLPVQLNGTLSQQATSSVVKNVLGGAVKNTDASGIPTVAVRDASGDSKSAAAAQVAVVNAGYSYVSGGTAPVRTTSRILYASTADRQPAEELAKTLGLPPGDVASGKNASNADVTVVLGQDYRPQTQGGQ